MRFLVRRTALRGALLLASTGIALADDLPPELPLQGWRVTATDSADFMQDVNYPANRVNAGNAASTAMISGHIAGMPKPHRGIPLLPEGGSAVNTSGDVREDAGAPLLIVNGTALPMPAEGGNYSRPWAFGTGTNNVEVRRADGTVVRRAQFHEGNAAQVPPRLRVILAWDSNHTDVDLHVIAPNGEHTWYGERVSSGGGALDVDVTDGYGPEIFASLAPQEGTWLVYANYYGGDSGKDITLAEVTVLQHENTGAEKRETFTVPLRKPGELNFVTRFIYQR